MDDYTCACGYDAVTAEELADHVGEMMIPPDDIAHDGSMHAVIGRATRGATGPDPAGHRCSCGFRATTMPDFDAHLLAAFTGPGVTGTDGHEHAQATPTAASVGG